jgi:xanthine/uracil/vitamin C permease (AzgA family)
MRRYFAFAAHGTAYRQETVAGITTFLTMGRRREVPTAMWLLAAMLLSFHVFYPYR